MEVDEEQLYYMYIGDIPKQGMLFNVTTPLTGMTFEECKEQFEKNVGYNEGTGEISWTTTSDYVFSYRGDGEHGYIGLDNVLVPDDKRYIRTLTYRSIFSKRKFTTSYLLPLINNVGKMTKSACKT